ncbi:MAG: hypothetical protein F4X14_08925 [Caldilineaceae bacterium SB0661_bin_32]|uniref:Uncharacterized protein n=1 Tax=Caldilineaceae bacterium SB0661_bin_32 TaxID=2605255 RepID=A0A6B1D6J3_9CHLR|nr:hypothetical protein [Caldilineaceae bacterium SB0661_bin_32]
MKPTDMVTVYRSDRNGPSIQFIYCALLPSAQVERAFSTLRWDLKVDLGMPSAVERYREGREQIDYSRYGDENGREPLVMKRNFDEMRDDYMEISEEFRLFHNLYHNRKTDEYIKIDDDGSEDTVILVRPDCIQIRLKEIRQFLAIKEMHLWIQYDYLEYAERSLVELGLKEGQTMQRDNGVSWRLLYHDSPGVRSYKALSQLLGNRLIQPLPKSKSGFPGFAEEPEEKHVEFIIDVDENGDEVSFISDPDALANHFGDSLHAPNYLTPVHFRRQVLDKYYQQPGKYAVEDSLLRCGRLWVMAIDNQHDDKVCAWLGDLGRDLPYQERLHWRAHNIPPSGKMSEIFYKRQVLAQEIDTDRPDLLFKERYDELIEACKEHLGWQLLQPLHSGDQHHLDSLRIPAADEQRDFDELVLSLAKILIDSLHVKRLNSLLSEEQKEGVGKGSIALLEAVLTLRNIKGGSEHIVFLRRLQSLRSSSSAHRKGSRYRKIAEQFDIEGQILRDVFAGILWQALDFLNFLIFLAGGGRVDNVEENRSEEGYAILSEMIGFVDSGATDGSVNHDDLIYELRAKP